MAQEIFLKENVLTDDILIIPDPGKVFKGQYIAIIKKYTFQNAWQDAETILKFRSKERLIKYLDKNYNGVDLDLTEIC